MVTKIQKPPKLSNNSTSAPYLESEEAEAFWQGAFAALAIFIAICIICLLVGENAGREAEQMEAVKQGAATWEMLEGFKWKKLQ